jgi:hypothetical protein
LGFSVGESTRNDRHDALYVREDIIVPEPEHAIAVRLQKFGSSCVYEQLSDLGVAIAVNLDDEPVCVTAKIHKIAADRGLPAKMSISKMCFAKMPPQFSFRRRHHAAQSAGKRHAPIFLSCSRVAARHAPHP